MSKKEDKPLEIRKPFIIARGQSKNGDGIVDFCGSQLELGDIILNIVDNYSSTICTDQKLKEMFVEQICELFDIELSWIENEKELYN
jgi:hypothetical protein